MSTFSRDFPAPPGLRHPHLGRRARLAAWRHRKEAALAHGPEHRGPLGWLRALWDRITASRTLGLAAEMAFWLFLSLLPLAAVAGLVTAKLASGNGSATTVLLASFPPAVRELIVDELGRMAAWNGGRFGLGAGAMFVWLASSGVHSIFDGIEIETEATPRPWWKKRLLAIVACIALSAGLALLALLGAGLGWLWHLVGGSTLFHALQIESSLLGKIFRLAVGILLACGLVSGLFWIALPPAGRRSMPVVPGALVAVALQCALGYGYGVYITKIGDGGAYQAGLASIGITLVTLYLFCLALLVGVEVNQMIGEARRRR